MTEGTSEQGRAAGAMYARAASWLAWSLCLLCLVLMAAAGILFSLNNRTS